MVEIGNRGSTLDEDGNSTLYGGSPIRFTEAAGLGTPHQ